MTKTYIKKKAEKSLGYRTSDNFRSKSFAKGPVKKFSFKPTSFKAPQHRA